MLLVDPMQLIRILSSECVSHCLVNCHLAAGTCREDSLPLTGGLTSLQFGNRKTCFDKAKTISDSYTENKITIKSFEMFNCFFFIFQQHYHT